MTNSNTKENAPLAELQSTGFAEINERIYKASTLNSLREWVQEKVEESERLNDNFLFQDDCAYLPALASYSSLRVNSGNTF